MNIHFHPINYSIILLNLPTQHHQIRHWESLLLYAAPCHSTKLFFFSPSLSLPSPSSSLTFAPPPPPPSQLPPPPLPSPYLVPPPSFLWTTMGLLATSVMGLLAATTNNKTLKRKIPKYKNHSSHLKPKTKTKPSWETPQITHAISLNKLKNQLGT